MLFRNRTNTTSAPPAPIIAPEPGIPELEERRAVSQAELEELQEQVGAINYEIPGLRAQLAQTRKQMAEAKQAGNDTSWQRAAAGADSLVMKIDAALDGSAQLCTAIEAKQAEVNKLDKLIREKRCEPIKRELEGHVRATAALLAQALEPNAISHKLWQQLLNLGANIPEVFIRELSVDTVCPTLYSKFLNACAQAGIEVEKPHGDVLTIPPPASFYFRQHDDFSHNMRLASNAAGNTLAVAAQAYRSGVVQGFRAGRSY